MPLNENKPRGLLRLALRLPAWLYRLRLGWMLGERFLLLMHTGRRSGRRHRTVIEVVHHDQSTDIYHVVAGFGPRSDWFLNLKHDPRASITVGRRTLEVQAREVPESEGVGILLDYARHHPIAFRELSTLLTGKRMEPSEENLLEFLGNMPLVALEPLEAAAGGPEG